MDSVKKTLLQNNTYRAPVNHWVESNIETFNAAVPGSALIPNLVYAHRLTEEDKKSFMVMQLVDLALNVEFHYQENQQWLNINTTMPLQGTDQESIIRNLMGNFLRFTETPHASATNNSFAPSIVPQPMMLLPKIRDKFIAFAAQINISDIAARSSNAPSTHLR